MKTFASLVAFFALFVAVLPGLDAQDVKDDPKKTDDPKGEEKKVEPKKKAPSGKVDEATVVNSVRLPGKIKDVKFDGENKEITFHGRDEKRYQEYLDWDRRFKQALPRIVNLNEQQKIDYYKRENVIQLDIAYSLDPKTITVTNNLRVRTVNPVAPLDDKTGKEKKLSGTELAKLKGGSRLPGYTADVGALRVGQIVEIYVPKSAVAPPKQVKEAPPATKKGFIRPDDGLAGGNPGAAIPKMEAYLILIVQD